MNKKLIAKKSKATPWSYRKGASLLHRLPAGLKLIFLLLYSLAVFFPGPTLVSFALICVIAFSLIFLSFISRIGPISLLRGSAPLFYIVLGTFFIQGIRFSPPGFNLEGIGESIIYCGRLGVVFAAGTLFFAVTTTGEIKKSLSHLESALHLEHLKLGLSISLMLGFLPRFFELWEDVNLAWKSRGGKKNLSCLASLVPLAVERIMIKAAETAAAMEARGVLL